MSQALSTKSIEDVSVEALCGVKKLLAMLAAMYGSKFLDAYASVPMSVMESTWRIGLKGLSAAEIESGVQACMCRNWPPTLPEFRNLCRPPVNLEDAWGEAQRGAFERKNGKFGEWSSPAIYWSYVRFGGFDLLNGSYANCKGRWEKVLMQTIADEQAGKLSNIPVPLPAIDAPGAHVTSKDVGAELIKSVAAVLKTEPEPGLQGDGLDWARRVVAKPEGRSWYAVKSAQEVLDNAARKRS